MQKNYKNSKIGFLHLTGIILNVKNYCKTVENKLKDFTVPINSGASITGIFPIPVYKKNIGRKFTDAELKASQPEAWHLRPGSDNVRADTTSVLNSPAFFGLKKFIDTCLEDFLKEIMAPETTCSLYATQSWINFNRKGDRHHQHFHSNSIVSGVFYLNTPGPGAITFNIPQRQPWHIQNTPNWWNMRKIRFPVSSGDLILFMSDLEHGVETQLHDETRVSLAFNTWFRGEIGSKEGLTYLSN
jgi:uncharacterized protein (TIGR02466 family)